MSRDFRVRRHRTRLGCLLIAMVAMLKLPGCRERSSYQPRAQRDVSTVARESSALPQTTQHPVPTERDSNAVSEGTAATAVVIRVIDGDTMDVVVGGNRSIRIRLAGVDAPEKGQPFGNAAGRQLRDQLLHTKVVVRPQKVDHYGRLIARVYLNGEDVGLAQIRRGLAWHYACYEWEELPEDRRRYADAEVAAENAHTGLWSTPGAVEPWIWRGRPCHERSEIGRYYDGHVIANRRTRTYFLPGCRGYSAINALDRVRFDSEAAAVAAGFTRSHGC